MSQALRGTWAKRGYIAGLWEPPIFGSFKRRPKEHHHFGRAANTRHPCGRIVFDPTIILRLKPGAGRQRISIGSLGEPLDAEKPPLRWTDEILHNLDTILCWYLQGNYSSRVSEVVQDFVHPQYHLTCSVTRIDRRVHWSASLSTESGHFPNSGT